MRMRVVRQYVDQIQIQVNQSCMNILLSSSSLIRAARKEIKAVPEGTETTFSTVSPLMESVNMRLQPDPIWHRIPDKHCSLGLL